MFKDLPEKFDHAMYGDVYNDFVLQINLHVSEGKLDLTKLCEEILSEVEHPVLSMQANIPSATPSKKDAEEISD